MIHSEMTSLLNLEKRLDELEAFIKAQKDWKEKYEEERELKERFKKDFEDGVKTLEAEANKVKELQKLLDGTIQKSIEKENKLKEYEQAMPFVDAFKGFVETLIPSQASAETDITLQRTVTGFHVEQNREVITIREGTIGGQILSMGLEGTLKDFRHGDFLKQLRVRGYGSPRLRTVEKELEELVRLGILARCENKGWVYNITERFKELVKN